MKILAIGDFQGKFPAKLKKRLSKENFDLMIVVGDITGVDEWRPYIVDMFKRIKRGDDRQSLEEFYGKAKLKALEKKDFELGKMILHNLDSFNKPTILIFGNSDDGWYTYLNRKLMKQTKATKTFMKKLRNIKDITYSNTIFKEFNIVGHGGYMDIEAYFRKNTFKAEKEYVLIKIKRHQAVKKLFFRLLKKVSKQKKPFIFVLHYPPYGIFDKIKDKRNPMNNYSAGVKFFREGIKKYKPKLVFCGHMHEYQGMKKLYGIPVINPGDAGAGKYAVIDVQYEDKIKVKFIKQLTTIILLNLGFIDFLMDYDAIRSLVKILEDSDIDSLEVRRWFGSSIKISKRRKLSYSQDLQHASVPITNNPQVELESASARVSNKQKYVLIESKWDSGPNKDLVIGAFYLCKNHENPDPESEDRAPIISEGSIVNQGEVLYYLEVLTFNNPIISPVTGIVRKILVEPGAFIQYGTKLFVIEKTQTQ